MAGFEEKDFSALDAFVDNDPPEKKKPVSAPAAKDMSALDAFVGDDKASATAPRTRDPRRQKIFDRLKKAGLDIGDDDFDDFERTASLESGRSHYNKDGSVKRGVPTGDGSRAIGYGQIMPGTAEKYKKFGLDPFSETDNIAMSAIEFRDGSDDPIGRRLAYVGGPKSKALAHYKKTGEVPDWKLYSYMPKNKETHRSYVEKSGGFKNWKSLDDAAGLTNRDISGAPQVRMQVGGPTAQPERDPATVAKFEKMFGVKVPGSKQTGLVGAISATSGEQTGGLTEQPVDPFDGSPVKYDFQTRGKTTGGLEYLGRINDKYVAKNKDGDEYEFDEKAMEFKPRGAVRRAIDTEGNEYMLAPDQRNVSEGVTRRTRDGANYLFTPDGKIGVEGAYVPPDWAIGKTPPVTALPNDPIAQKAYQNRLDQGIPDTEEFRRKFVAGYAAVKSGKQAAIFDESDQKFFNEIDLAKANQQPTPVQTKVLRQAGAPADRTAAASSPGQATFYAQIDPARTKEGGDPKETVYRQAAKQIGAQLYGRELNSVEVEALVEEQKRSKQHFAFKTEGGNPTEIPSDDVTGERKFQISGERAAEMKAFLDANQEKIAKIQSDMLAKRVGTPLPLDEQEIAQLAEYGITPEMVEAAYSNDPKFADARNSLAENTRKVQEEVQRLTKDDALLSPSVAELSALSSLGFVPRDVFEKVAKEEAEARENTVAATKDFDLNREGSLVFDSVWNSIKQSLDPAYGDPHRIGGEPTPYNVTKSRDAAIQKTLQDTLKSHGSFKEANRVADLQEAEFNALSEPEKALRYTKHFAQGVANIALEIPRSVGTARTAVDTAVAGAAKQILGVDIGGTLRGLRSVEAGAADWATLGWLYDEQARERMLSGKVTSADSPWAKTAKYLQDVVGRDEYLDKTTSGQITSGLASATVFLAGGFALKGSKYGITALGAGMEMAGIQDELKAAGVDDETAAVWALPLATLSGASENLGLGGLAGKQLKALARELSEDSAKTFLRSVWTHVKTRTGREILQETPEEGLQELGQSSGVKAAIEQIAAKDKTGAQKLIDFFDSLPRHVGGHLKEGAIGAATGALFTGGTSIGRGALVEGMKASERKQDAKIDAGLAEFDAKNFDDLDTPGRPAAPGTEDIGETEVLDRFGKYAGGRAAVRGLEQHPLDAFVEKDVSIKPENVDTKAGSVDGVDTGFEIVSSETRQTSKPLPRNVVGANVAITDKGEGRIVAKRGDAYIVDFDQREIDGTTLYTKQAKFPADQLAIGGTPLTEYKAPRKVKQSDAPTQFTEGELLEARNTSHTETADGATTADVLRQIRTGRAASGKGGAIQKFAPNPEQELDSVYTPQNDEYKVAPAVVEEDDILASFDEGYPEVLQPRDRRSIASDIQIMNIAKNLIPAKLGDSVNTNDGRPIAVPVTVDGKLKYALITGNGRLMSIRAARENFPDSYKGYADFARSKDPSAKAKNPVYIALLDNSVLEDGVLRGLAVDSNKSQQSAMSPVEQAKVDAETLDASIMQKFSINDKGEIESAANRGFITEFFKRNVTENEQGSLIDNQGTLTVDGVNRIKRAIIARAFGETEVGLSVLSKMIELPIGSVQNVVTALTRTAPMFAELKSAIETGNAFKEIDITDEVAIAFNQFADLKAAGSDVDAFLRQIELPGAPTLNGIEKRLVEIFQHYAKAPAQLTDVLRNYLSGANGTGDPNQQNMFGEAAVVPYPGDLLKAAVETFEEENGVKDEKQLKLTEFEQGSRRERPSGRVEKGDKAGTKQTKKPTAETVDDETEQTPEAPEPAAVPEPVIQEQVTGQLPADLRGAKPRYGYGSKLFELDFESDFDRAAYIAAQQKPSKRDADYVRWAVFVSGMDEMGVRDHGSVVRGFIKGLARDGEAGSTLHIPAQDQEQVTGNTAGETEPDTSAVENNAVAPEKSFGAENALVTTSRADELKAKITAKLTESQTRLSAGLPVDPELLKDATELGVFYIEGGLRKFNDFARQMIEDLGDGIRPFLKSVYAGVYYYPGLDNAGMDSLASIDGVDVDAITLTEPLTKPLTENVAEAENVRAKPKPLSNTQVEFSPEQAKPFDDFRRTVIDPADVADRSVLPEYAKDGIFEIEPHVTVKYGLTTNSAADVEPTLKGEKPITLELGKTSVFKGSEKKIPGTDKPVPYDVVIVSVKSKDLERLNKKLTDDQENSTTFPYSPHVTLAYVKAGEGEKYANRDDFEGQKYTFDGVTFSPADKSGKSVIPLGGKPQPTPEAGSTLFDLGGLDQEGLFAQGGPKTIEAPVTGDNGKAAAKRELEIQANEKENSRTRSVFGEEIADTLISIAADKGNGPLSAKAASAVLKLRGDIEKKGQAALDFAGTAATAITHAYEAELRGMPFGEFEAHAPLGWKPMTLTESELYTQIGDGSFGDAFGDVLDMIDRDSSVDPAVDETDAEYNDEEDVREFRPEGLEEAIKAFEYGISTIKVVRDKRTPLYESDFFVSDDGELMYIDRINQDGSIDLAVEWSPNFEPYEVFSTVEDFHEEYGFRVIIPSKERDDVTSSDTDLAEGNEARVPLPIRETLPDTQRAADAEGVRPGSEEAGTVGDRPADSDGVSAPGTVPAGTRSDSEVRDGVPGTPERPAGDTDSGRSSALGPQGLFPDFEPSEAVRELADSSRSEHEQKYARQLAAEKIDVALTDIANIRETLPYLMPGQQEDVAFAERRFEKADGVMFTNGTGTGKTFTGLGIAKRFEKQGKDNILILAPSDKILSDWERSAQNLNLTINRLRDTNSNGKSGIVSTTYANFYQNASLLDRQWDLIITDESHKILQNIKGEETAAVVMLRAATLHERAGAYNYDQAKNYKHHKAYAELLEQMKPYLHMSQRYMSDADKKAFNELETQRKVMVAEARRLFAEATEEFNRRVETETRPKVTFLSATPFAYDKVTDYAEGYLFTYGPEPAAPKPYNTPDARGAFMVEHFGYRMRYNKLTRPDADVNTEAMEIQFNSLLKEQGALSGRTLDIDFDYSREFVVTESAIGQKIDEGFSYLHETRKSDKQGSPRKFPQLADYLNKRFNYLARRFTLEAINTRAAIPIIKEQLKMGRKVVVFHDYKKNEAVHPFAIDADVLKSPVHIPGYDFPVDLRPQYAEFAAERPDLVGMDLSSLGIPIDVLKEAFGPEAVFFNGDVPPKKRRAAADDFNNDDGRAKIMIAQSAAGREGISLHDTSGKYQRVLINLGLPTAPIASIQIEGRIYRVGNESDAIQLYMTTGTNFEQFAFATTISQRASTAENLAMGEEARGLRQAFIEGYTNANANYKPNTGEGKGGKDSDRVRMQTMTPYEKARTFYFGQQKKTSKTKAAEGVDYFATPEPVGFKMVEWADQQFAESTLEPSAGHGAIARFFRTDNRKTLVEPSTGLASRLALRTDGKIVQSDFEELHTGANKFDTIIMNPPFGSGGKTAVEHLAKAAQHLQDFGRIVALLPSGPAADKQLEKFLTSKEAANLYLIKDLKLPSVVFKRAAATVMTHIIVLDKYSKKPVQLDGVVEEVDYTDFDDINQFFDAFESEETMPRLTASEVYTSAQPAAVAIVADRREAQVIATSAGGAYQKTEFTHTRDGHTIYVAKMVERVGPGEFSNAKTIAKRHGGYYSSYNGSGAIRGFHFKTADARDKFVGEAEEPGGAEDGTMLSILSDDAENFASYIDRYTSGSLRVSQKAGLVLSSTPEVFQHLGARNLPIGIQYSKVKKILDDKHILSSDILKQIPAEIADPVAIIDYVNPQTGEKSLNILSTLTDAEGNPILIGFQPNQKMGRHDVNLIPTVFGKQNFGHTLRKWEKNGDFRYINKKRSQEFSTTYSTFASVVQSVLKTNPNILTDTDLVNTDDGTMLSIAEPVRQANTFFSAVERATLETRQEKFSLDQVRGLFAKSPGVKAEEVDQLGFELLLQMKEMFGEKSISKTELLETVAANQIRVEPVVREGEVKNHDDLVEYYVDHGHSRDSAEEMALAETRGKNEGAQFAKWIQPFPEAAGYKEVFLTAPAGKQMKAGRLSWQVNWNDGHSQYADIANPIVRLRWDERTLADGRKALMIHELQGPSPDNVENMPTVLRKYHKQMGLKYAVQYAAMNNFDAVAWTTGDQQTERYDLSRDVESIDFTTNLSGQKMVNINTVVGPKKWKISLLVDDNGMTFNASEPDFNGKSIAELVPKQFAKRIMDEKSGVLEADGLKLGGNALRDLYEKVIPSFVKKIYGRFGVKVEQGEVLLGESKEFDSTQLSFTSDVDQARMAVLRGDQVYGVNRESRTLLHGVGMLSGFREYQIVPVSKRTPELAGIHVLPILDSMRDTFQREGQAMFSIEEETRREAVRLLKNVPVDELTNAANFDRTGDRIKMDLPGMEMLRRAFEQVDIDEGKRELGGDEVYPSFMGLFTDPGKIRKVARVLVRTAKDARDKGFVGNAAVLDVFAENIQKAAEVGRGTAIFYVLDAKLPQEIFHQGVYLGSVEKALGRRHARPEKLDAHPAFKKAVGAFFGLQPEYSIERIAKTRKLGLKQAEAFRNALIREEVAAWIAEGSHAEIGLTEAEADSYLLDFFESFADKVYSDQKAEGKTDEEAQTAVTDALQHFEEIDYAREAVEQTKTGIRTGISTGKSRRGNAGDTRTRQPRGASESDPVGDKQEPAPLTGFEPRTRRHVFGDAADLGVKGKDKSASLPGTARAAGIASDDVIYTVFGDREASRMAEKLISENGIDGTIKILKTTESPDVHHAIAAFSIQRALRDEAIRIEEANPEESRKLTKISLDLGAMLAMKMVRAGRFIRAASVIAKTTQGIVTAAQKAYQDKHGLGQTLSSDVVRRIEEKFGASESALAEYESLKKQLDEVQRELNIMKQMNAGIETKKGSYGRISTGIPRSRSKLVKQIKTKHQKEVEEAMQWLTGKALIKVAFDAPAVEMVTAPAAASQGDLTMMSVFDESILPPELLKNLSTVGAMILTERLASDSKNMIRPAGFDEQMIAGYGEEVKPHLDTLHREALRLRNQWIKDVTKEERVRNILREMNADLTNDEVRLIVGDDLDGGSDAFKDIAREVGAVMLAREDEIKRRQMIVKLHETRADRGSKSDKVKAIEGIIQRISESDDAAAAAVELIHTNPSAHEFYRKMEALGIKGFNDMRARNALRQGRDLLEKAKMIHAKQEAKLKDELRTRIADGDAELKDLGALTATARKRARDAQVEIEKEVKRIKGGEFGYYIETGREIINTPRAIMASTDLSFLLRQGGWFMLARPGQQALAFRAIIQSTTTRFNKIGYDRMMQEMEGNPYFELAVRSGMDFAGLGKHGEFSITKGEEEFRSNFLKMLAKPTEGKAGRFVNPAFYGNAIIQKSDELYTAFLDGQRLATFAATAQYFSEQLNLTFEENPKEFRALAEYINDATGRSWVGGSKAANLLMNLPLFAPRFTVSRFKLLWKSTAGMLLLPPATRKVVLRDALQFYGITGGLTALAWMAGASAGLDWDDDDFLKIKIGDNHYDLFVGMQQPLRASARSVHAALRRFVGSEYSFGLIRDSVYHQNADGAVIANEFKNDMGVDPRKSIWLKFLRSKLGPLASLGADYTLDEDFLGNKFAWGKAITSRISPLGIREVAAAMYDRGPLGALAAVPSLLGPGYAHYPSDIDTRTNAERLASKINGMRFERKTESEEAKVAREIIYDARDEVRSIARDAAAGKDVTARQVAIEEQVTGLYEMGQLTKAEAERILRGGDISPLAYSLQRMPVDLIRQVRAVADNGEKAVIDSIVETRAAKEAKTAKRTAAREELFGKKPLDLLQKAATQKSVAERLGRADVTDALVLWQEYAPDLTSTQQFEMRKVVKQKVLNSFIKGTLKRENYDAAKKIFGDDLKIKYVEPKPKKPVKRPGVTSLENVY